MARWRLIEDGYPYDWVEAASAQEALEVAREQVDRDNYPAASEDEGSRWQTIWIDVEVRCEQTDERESATVQLDPPEPSCVRSDSEHDWQSPHALVGGIAENPGVRGHGGGVIIHEVCVRCGCGRVTDTWAQRPDTGEQGLESVAYTPGEYSDELEQLLQAS